MRIRTAINLLNLLAALALLGLPLLFLAGCQTPARGPITIPAPIPFTSLR